MGIREIELKFQKQSYLVQVRLRSALKIELCLFGSISR